MTMWVKRLLRQILTYIMIPGVTDGALSGLCIYNSVAVHTDRKRCSITHGIIRWCSPVFTLHAVPDHINCFVRAFNRDKSWSWTISRVPNPLLLNIWYTGHFVYFRLDLFIDLFIHFIQIFTFQYGFHNFLVIFLKFPDRFAIKPKVYT